MIANRGEIAVRIARAVHELGMDSIAIYSQDDAQALHRFKATEAVALPGQGAAAYLDIGAVVAAAVEAGADGVHPGYGFLSENADFAKALEDAGIKFVGPTSETIGLFGDKTRARALAERLGVPLVAGTGEADVEEVKKEKENNRDYVSS